MYITVYYLIFDMYFYIGKIWVRYCHGISNDHTFTRSQIVKIDRNAFGTFISKTKCAVKNTKVSENTFMPYTLSILFQIC